MDVIAVGGQGILESAPFEREAANDVHVANDMIEADNQNIRFPAAVAPRDFRLGLKIEAGSWRIGR